MKTIFTACIAACFLLLSISAFSSDLFALCRTGTVEDVRTSIDSGADISARNLYDLTPLMQAVRYNADPQVAALLLERGADIHARDRNGYTPLMWSVWNENPEIIKLLLERGAEVHSRSWFGLTTLMYAARNSENPAVLEVLLNYGADIQARDSTYGMTPLMRAAHGNRNPEVIRFLISRGGDVSAVSFEGRRASHYLQENHALADTDIRHALGLQEEEQVVVDSEPVAASNP